MLQELQDNIDTDRVSETNNGRFFGNGHHNGNRHLPSSLPAEADNVDTQVRYREILFFFGRLIAHFILWDIVVKRMPLLGGWTNRTRPQRFRRWSYRFRLLAVQKGGVLIKLGQFMSARVDILPPEVTEELQGLQDEVPPVPLPQIWATIQAELGDTSLRFAHIETDPLAAASLGQTHRAWLLPSNGTTERGEAVVIKVQRPHIEAIVKTDLEALRVVSRWLMRYGPIRRRANVPALMEEFAYTLWEELDYESEADNAERFARMYADHERVYIPAVYRQHSTKRVLVLENVEGLKVNDLVALEAAGIDPKEVAAVVFDAYFQQFFRESFFHADPHPGNLFIRPRTDIPWTSDDGPRPFWLIFIDFGMVGHIRENVSDNLYKLLISVIQRDGSQLTEAYNNLGFFLPGSDLERIAEAQTILLERIWGRNLMELAQPDPQEVQELGQEFRDILFEFPFQIPQDFIYLGRAIGMMSGLMTSLDPEINPWYLIEQYGRQLMSEQRVEFTWETVLGLIRPYLATPGRVRKLLEDAEKGRLRLQTKPDRETLRRLERVEKRVGQLNWSVLGAAGIISAALLWRDRQRR